MLESAYLDDLQIHGAAVGVARYDLTQFDYNLPDVRSTVLASARRHGAVDYTSLYGPRVFAIAGEVWGKGSASDPFADLWSSVDALKARLLPGQDVTLRFTRSGKSEQQVTVRPGSAFDIPMRGGAAFTTFAGSLVAADPRIYSAELHSLQYDPTLAGSGLGVTFPLVFPLAFTGSALPGSLVIENLGTFPTFPTLTVNGPATNPTITNVTTGEVITTTASLATSSDSLWIDVAKREVRLGGSSGTLRPDLIDVSATTFFDLETGVSELTLGGTGHVEAQTFLKCEWRDAWI